MTMNKKGPLQTKLKPRYLPLLVNQAEQMAVIEGWRKEDREKMLLLCEELAISDGPDRFYNLALALARKQYAGFQQVAPLSKWTEVARGYLVVEVERLTAEGLDVKAAASVLAGRPEWKAFLSNTRDGGEGLRVQYQKFKGDRIALVIRDAFKHFVVENRLEEWHKNLLEALENPHPQSHL